ncbi:MAG: amine oxidase [Acidobacteria bacterium]|nr:MAG: amine oxidase [Acidobacteriota bacterium]
MPEVWDALVVGGGHNGLVTAAYLARAGWRVLVLERRPVLGGACATEEVFPGFKFSTAAYLCSLLHERIIRELDLPRHGYRIYPKDPAYFAPFPDGSHFMMWQDQAATCREIAKFSTRDAETYPRYEAHLERLARFAERMLLRTPPNLGRMRAGDIIGFGRLGLELLRLGDAGRFGQVKAFTASVADFLAEWFDSEALRVSLATDGVIGSYAGPRSPGTAYVLLHHGMGKLEGRRGLWGFARGGMGAVSEAIARSARAAGAELRTGAEVAQILVERGRAAGVALASGEEIRARVVASNADPKRTFLALVDRRELEPEFARAVERIRMNASAMKINLALDGLPDFKAVPGSLLQPHHKTTIHICPTIDYAERAWDDCKQGRPSSRPLLEITIPTTYDDSLAPPGKHVMNIFLQYTPYRPDGADWSALKEPYADSVMDLVEEYAPGFKDRVLARQVLSPADLEEIFGLTGGNIFHGDMSVDQLFCLRPLPGWAEYRTPIENLYLCGAGTHPGGGVTGAPGYNAARRILRDRRARGGR